MVKELTFAKELRSSPEIRASFEGCTGIRSYKRNSSPPGTSLPNSLLSAPGEVFGLLYSFLYPQHPAESLGQRGSSITIC